MTWEPDKYNVVTNHHYRPLLRWDELTTTEQEAHDYLDTPGRREEADFFRYRGETYDLGEFEVAPDSIRRFGFDAHQTQSYFDTIAIRCFDEDGEYTGCDEGIVVAHIHW